jgi:hypothetical protein
LLAIALHDTAADDRMPIAGCRFEGPHPALLLGQQNRDCRAVLHEGQAEPIIGDQNHIVDGHDAIAIGIADDVLPDRIAGVRGNEGLEGIGETRRRMAIDRPTADKTEFRQRVAIRATRANKAAASQAPPLTR